MTALVAILTRGVHTGGQALGFGFGSKVTTAGLDIVPAVSAARIMIGPLHLQARIGGRLHRCRRPHAGERGLPRQPARIMIASLGCLDTFVKIDGRYFAERNLARDWSETRPST